MDRVQAKFGSWLSKAFSLNFVFPFHLGRCPRLSWNAPLGMRVNLRKNERRTFNIERRTLK